MHASNFSFFALGDQPESLGVDEKGNPIRKRQQHRKSRNGCQDCKRRKVKCDEALPSCHNCTKRKLKCSFVASPKNNKKPTRYVDPVPSSMCCSWDLHMASRSSDSQTYVSASDVPGNIELILRRSPADRELFRYFERFTSGALALSSDIWGTEVLTSALKDDYLMSAVLLVASSHINYYLPNDHPDRRPVLHHFANALSGLRVALAEEITATTFESIIGCSILLIHYSWTYVDAGPNDELDIGYLFRETVALLHGLKDCVVAAQDVFHQTKWSKVLMYSPRLNLERYIRESKGNNPMFSDMLHHCLFCGLGTKCTDGASADNMSAASRLLIPLQALKLSLPDFHGSDVASDVLRYLFTWPTLCTKGYVQQVKENNPTSLTILLYYYSAIVSVLSDKIWWMRDRAIFMFNILRSRLEGQCDECTGPAIALCSPEAGLPSWYFT